MKKFGIVILIILTIALSSWAEEMPITDKSAVHTLIERAKLGESISADLLKQADLEKNDIQEQIDLVLNQLLSLPFEQRQYVFPALFDTPSVPKKIRTHPEIAIWEGKLPTDIAPQVRDYAAKYLKDMNPKLYIYLSPEAYRQDGRDLPMTTRAISLPIPPQDTSLHPSVRGTPTTYLSIPELWSQPTDLAQNPDKHILTTESLQKIKTGLNVFNTFMNQDIQGTPELASGYRMLTLFSSNPDIEKINPFQAKLDRLHQMQLDGKLDILLQQAGWQNATEFAQTTDAMIRAYRAARMPLRVAFEARRYRGQKPSTDLERLVVTRAKMYESLPADVRLVQQYLPQIQQIFAQAGYQSVLNAETVDEARK